MSDIRTTFKTAWLLSNSFPSPCDTVMKKTFVPWHDSFNGKIFYAHASIFNKYFRFEPVDASRFADREFFHVFGIPEPIFKNSYAYYYKLIKNM